MLIAVPVRPDARAQNPLKPYNAPNAPPIAALKPTFTMNYIGSKLKLLAEIRAMLDTHGIRHGSFCDIFSGTSVVAQMAKIQGFDVISNDLQAYSCAMQAAFIRNNGYPRFKRLMEEVPAIDAQALTITPSGQELHSPGAKRSLTVFGLSGDRQSLARHGLPLVKVLHYLSSLPGEDGPFVDAYCEGGSAARQYFSRENGQACQAIRSRLQYWLAAEWISRAEFDVLLASLLESMDMVANTASVYGAFLKQIKRTARQPLTLKVPLLLEGTHEHRVFQEDANALIKRLALEGTYEVLYIDPPYNRRQYHSNYHVLETIAVWDLDAFEPRGKTGLRPTDNQRSAFALQKDAKRAMTNLIEDANFKHILISYNNEGLIPEDDLIAMLNAKSPSGIRDYKKISYKRFRADNDGETRTYKGDTVDEFLFYIQTG
jgi:adenine-specific DNA-methyltransferase